MKQLNFFLFKSPQVGRISLFVLLFCSLLTITGVGGLLFYFGIGHINYPDRNRFPIRGVDISSHQQQIDWARLDRSNINFILMKATEGGNFKDPRFQDNWRQARQQGTIVGAYHFFTFCKSGREQAQNYIETVPKQPGTLPPVIDLEFSGNCQSQPTQAGLETELNTFIAIVEKFYHKRPILYVTHEFYDRYLQNRYADRPIWISDFYSFNKLPILADGKQWQFWQYSERGRVAGIPTLVDLNVFNGDKTQFDRLINTEVMQKRP
ncbi:glycoside hydrolase family 25 protein [Chamaesiphon polymorphus]|uniref:Lysozyme n=1 Tax=Chamaesiphon polymorphus CCALA 037 TaxID=2107692 RepID=A0A2T1G7A4_9CYAN|nr:GH25 family lysozyme [Chamaesiphon polymorphus]PSB53128.1 lysozyme [Chamaesiphon polymorphus CCALA 037]